MIIALSGYGAAGKDSVADVLVDKYLFRRYAWADTLRLAAEALNPIVGIRDDGTAIRYTDAIDEVGYIEAKAKYPELRRTLQRIGTEVGRNLIGKNVWVNATLSRIERECSLGDNIVITDTRFPNEAEVVTNPNAPRLLSPAFVVRVNRPGVGPAGDHPSETSLDDYPFDSTIDNDGSLEDLAVKVEILIKSLETSTPDLQLF